MKATVAANAFSHFLRNFGELKFAFLQVTTRCNAMCLDRCNIWASKPIDLSLDDATFAVDVLAKNSFSFIYFTGGETGLYPHLAEVLAYAKKKGMITSITSNGTISPNTLIDISKNLDILSVSVDHYDERLWDQAKHVAGISKTAKETIRVAKKCGLRLYAITFLNPTWTVKDVEQTIHYVNDQLGISFAMSYPYFSLNDGTFTVGGNLSCSHFQTQKNLRNMVAKVLEMKLLGSDVATVSGYLRDVVSAHDGLPMRYPCTAGRTSLVIDCNLDVFPCYMRQKIFNLRDCQNLKNCCPDTTCGRDMSCFINCFREASLASKGVILKAVREEICSNPKFYLKLLM
ncbi:MAG: radical SAM protein [Candidatus Bathyarchaeota archaeon]|nr:radical SAM protein [Candidatus Bathyarchaeota archaeon]